MDSGVFYDGCDDFADEIEAENVEKLSQRDDSVTIQLNSGFPLHPDDDSLIHVRTILISTTPTASSFVNGLIPVSASPVGSIKFTPSAIKIPASSSRIKQFIRESDIYFLPSSSSIVITCTKGVSSPKWSSVLLKTFRPDKILVIHSVESPQVPTLEPIVNAQLFALSTPAYRLCTDVHLPQYPTSLNGIPGSVLSQCVVKSIEACCFVGAHDACCEDYCTTCLKAIIPELHSAVDDLNPELNMSRVKPPSKYCDPHYL